MIAFIQVILLQIFVRLRLIRKPDFMVQLVDAHPDQDSMEPGVIYVVGGRGYQKWAYFRCPAKRDEIVQLALMPKHRPRWEVKGDWLGRPSVHPSVRQLEGSYAHFWIRQGRIDWCPDSGVRSAPFPYARQDAWR